MRRRECDQAARFILTAGVIQGIVLTVYGDRRLPESSPVNARESIQDRDIERYAFSRGQLG